MTKKAIWSEWIHESRLHLIRTGVDWVIHMGHEGEKKPGLCKRLT